MKQIILSLLLATFTGMGLQTHPEDPQLTYEQSVFLFETKDPLSFSQMERLKKINGVKSLKLFSSRLNSPFFKKFYRVTTSVHNESIISIVEKLVDVVYIERPQPVTAFTVIPGESGLTNDPYSRHQWGLSQTGQIIIEDKNQYEQFQMKPRSTDRDGQSVKDDIGAEVIDQRNLDEQFQRDVIVAVLDSGVDYLHEDLSDNILRNRKKVEGSDEWEFNECDERGRPRGGIRPPTDDLELPEGNGFPGDCVGWNFVDENKSHKPEDTTGHGTHVAGIIAAVKNNNLGVAGFSNRIKILPVKVLKVQNSGRNPRRRRGTQQETPGSYIDRVAAGIDYALLRGADVINMSYGWTPKSNNNARSFEEIMRIVAESDTVFVAGAGNNNHNVPIFPCSYPGVICAGSIDIDGEVSKFSNYGSHVDFLAPGQEVISLFANGVPETKYPSSFDVAGLGRKSGTSQSAPFISGIAAVLKGLNPDIKPSEVYARLAVSSYEPKDRDKNTIGGIVKLDQAIDATPQVYVQPVLKGNNLVETKTVEQAAEFKILVPFKNFWLPTTEPTLVKISTDTPGIAIAEPEISLPAMESGSAVEVEIIGQAESMNSESHLQLEFTIGENKFTREYVLFNGDQNVAGSVEWDIEDSENFYQVIQNNLRTGRSPINTAYSPKGRFAQPLYYLYETPADKMIYHFFQPSTSGGPALEKLRTVEIPFASAEFFIQRRDLNGNGQLDLLIGTIRRETDENGNANVALQFSYYDHQLNDLYPNNHMEVMDKSLGLPNAQNISILRLQHSIIDNFASIVFVDQGPLPQVDPGAIPDSVGGEIPEVDHDPDPFNLSIAGIRNRLYYYEPIESDGRVKLQKRSFIDYQFDDKVRELARPYFPAGTTINFDDDIELVTAIHQTQDQISNNQLSLVISMNESTPRNCQEGVPLSCGPYDTYFSLIVDGTSLQTRQFGSEELKLSEYGRYLTDRFNRAIDIDGNRVLDLNGQTPVTRILSDRVETESSSAFYQLSEDRMTLSNVFVDASQPERPHQSTEVRLDEQEERIEQYFASFEKGNDFFSLARSKNDIYVVTANSESNEIVQSKVKVVASDFLPGHLSVETFVSLIVDVRGSLSAGLYKNSTAIYQNLFQSIVLESDGVHFPIGLNRVFDPSCTELNPVQIDAGASYFSLFCRRGETYKIELFPMRVD